MSAEFTRPDYARLATEGQHPASERLDEMSAAEIVEVMNALDMDAVRAVSSAKAEIARAVETAHAAVRAGGRVVYVGAGTSGRLGVLDASECPPTFGVPETLFIGVIAGGDAALRRSLEDAEDDRDAGARAMRELNIGKNDFVIGISASGTARFCLGAMASARASGAKVGAIACNGGSPMAAEADIAITLPTGAEALSGSTRLKAGTATKLALNMISTGAMALSGKTYKNLMVDVRATNAKLRDRCVRIVMRATALPRAEAEETLARADGDVKRAIVMAVAGADAETARAALIKAGGRVKEALSSLGG